MATCGSLENIFEKPLLPPTSCIGRSGKPWVCFKSYREDGWFILNEIRIPTQEFLHACRENGRLKLQFIQSDDEILEEVEDEEDEDEDGNGENTSSIYLLQFSILHYNSASGNGTANERIQDF